MVRLAYGSYSTLLEPCLGRFEQVDRRQLPRTANILVAGVWREIDLAVRSAHFILV